MWIVYKMYQTVSDYTNIIPKLINELFAKCDPFHVFAITATTIFIFLLFWNLIHRNASIWTEVKNEFFRNLKRIPFVRKKIDEKINTVTNDFENEIARSCKGLKYLIELPNKGLTNEQIIDLVDKHIGVGHYNWQNGHVSGAVYGYRKDIIELITSVYSKASYTNPLHSDIFPGICKMEAEVVRMACNLFHGDSKSCGTMTTGGTESILMACKAYRDFARETKGISSPNIVAPKTAHAAFDKAGQYFNIRVKYINVNPDTLEADMRCMKKAINKNTILLVGSAPNFPYGTMDNIEEIAALGIRYNIPVHVDACLGSFLIALANEVGYSIRPFDFRVRGVTSISADTHKYGFTPKGSSLILYSDKKYRNHQFTVTTDWPGGIYGSPTINGSRAGGNIATCWATMMSYGRNGYMEATKRIMDTARYIEERLRNIKEIYVFGNPATSVIAIGSNVFDIFRLSDSLCKKGWNLNALQFPPGIHFCVTDIHTQPDIADEFLTDLRAALSQIMKNPGKPVEGKMAIYGVSQGISDRSIVGEVVRSYLNSVYYTPK